MARINWDWMARDVAKPLNNSHISQHRKGLSLQLFKARNAVLSVQPTDIISHVSHFSPRCSRLQAWLTSSGRAVATSCEDFGGQAVGRQWILLDDTSVQFCSVIAVFCCLR